MPDGTAIRTRQPVRQTVAIAMRPDGSRIAFRPYPTPLFDAGGNLTGAVNLLVDISTEQAGALKDQARRCHRLASATTDAKAIDILRTMAGTYEATAAALRPAA